MRWDAKSSILSLMILLFFSECARLSFAQFVSLALGVWYRVYWDAEFGWAVCFCARQLTIGRHSTVFEPKNFAMGSNRFADWPIGHPVVAVCNRWTSIFADLFPHLVNAGFVCLFCASNSFCNAYYQTEVAQSRLVDHDGRFFAFILFWKLDRRVVA